MAPILHVVLPHDLSIERPSFFNGLVYQIRRLLFMMHDHRSYTSVQFQTPLRNVTCSNRSSLIAIPGPLRCYLICVVFLPPENFCHPSNQIPNVTNLILCHFG